MQAGINDIKNGLSIEMEGEVYYVVSYENVKPGKGSAFVRTRMKNIKTGAVIERTFRNEKIETADIDKKTLQFMYSSGDIYEFMDIDNYEHVALHKDQLGEVGSYLKENLEVTALVYKDKVITLEPPMFMDLKIIETEPGVRGDTSKSGNKPAKTETGLIVSVPLFINEGDVVRIDTRTKGYTGRV
ncbi:MAG: elongation factor P [Candidatus Omnitrophota bacterium]|nr:elongation factor P [Candidatus Omnitrophota bacterium]